ncbi:hypothetical protein [Paenibacillus sp. CF384]|uniref:hypothetical protein n=1 Tax=Paenibacillus sp. CF384 TaxID=1884382 RepID=UPI00089B958C|nr:hypothetical protein [Paenibacillus sp. CF384]SDX80014.1 hypothetical protein SAMN05518855_102230 [Paenibacillus sp. CF384]
MKKRMLFTTLLCLTFMISFFGYRHFHTQELRVDGKEKLYSLNELEQMATLIVRGTLSEKVSTDIVFDNEKVPSEFKTYSTFVVQKVYKPKNTSVINKDKIKVVEWYADWRDISGAYRIVGNEVYIPLKDNKEYVLFLYNEPGKDYYEIIGLQQGKYNFDKAKVKDGSVLTDDLAALEINERDPYYEEKYKQVFEKYK